MYKSELRRYQDLLEGEFRWVTDAMSWSVVTKTSRSIAVEQMVAALGATVTDQDLGDEPDDGECLWFLRGAGDAVMLLEVNGFQASRPEVLRRLSRDGCVVHSAFWNVENDSTFSFAADGDVVTAFDGEFPDNRYGSHPDALEDVRVPLWAQAGAGFWKEAMLALVEVRTGVALGPSWFDGPIVAASAPELPDDVTAMPPDPFT